MGPSITHREPYCHVTHSDFSSPRPFLPPPWTTTDDRLRNGTSESFLTALPNNGALFYGHVDPATLGGAGFASQYSPTITSFHHDTAPAIEVSNDSYQVKGGDAPWDLTAYAGLEIRLGRGDGRYYTLILKDAKNGGEAAGFNWEAEFLANNRLKEDDDENCEEQEEKSQGLWLPWRVFKATFRGRESKGGERLDTSNITRVGIMMRSLFGKQEGDFRLEVKSIAAKKESVENDLDIRAESGNG